MNRQEFKETLFADMDWHEWRDLKELKNIAISYIQDYPGRTRKNLWQLIVNDHFMRFSSSEYRQALTELVKEKIVHSPTSRKTYRLNDDCILFYGDVSSS
jgi:hypothetical protein